MMFSGREPTKTVPVHFAHVRHAASADDSCLSTGEWGRDSVDGAD